MGIEIKNVFYTYLYKTVNETSALRGVDLTIQDKSFTAILGETGCGKSTLIQTMNALLLPLSGEVKVDEFIVTPKKKKNKNIKGLRKHLSIVFQFPEYQLFEDTVEKDVAFGLKNFGYKEEEAIKEAHKALLAVGLDESYFKRSPLELSGGEKRRVALADIISINPEILVLDEPTAGLDPLGVKEIMSLIKKMHEEGHTIILVTHDMTLVQEYCTDAVVMHEGKVVFHDKPEVLLKQNTEQYAIETTPLFHLLNQLKNKGVDLPYENINRIQDLIEAIKERKKQHD
jgi:energy-coupling factor transport system ATP-binding protein